MRSGRKQGTKMVLNELTTKLKKNDDQSAPATTSGMEDCPDCKGVAPDQGACVTCSGTGKVSPKAKVKGNTSFGLRSITQNLKAAKVRHETLEGRPHLAVPMIMITHGVHTGSGGPLYYPKEELDKTPEIWNHKPIVVYHPQINGQGVSACDPDILNGRKIGVIMNTRFDGEKLHSEAWIEEDRTKKIDNRVLEALEKGSMLEVSTGLFTDNEAAEGEYKGKKYSAIARNYRADHLAILPDLLGACSIKDGAGLLRTNEVSFTQVRDLLSSKLREDPTNYSYVEDVFSTFFVYAQGAKLYAQNYRATDTDVTFVGEPKEVSKVVRYHNTDGMALNEGATDQETTTTKESNMLFNRKTAIAAMILANTIFNVKDQAFLESKSDAQLQLLEKNLQPSAPATNAAAPDMDNCNDACDDDCDGDHKAKKGSKALKKNSKEPAQNSAQAPRPVTEEEYIANAPPGVRDVLSESLQNRNEQKVALVKQIMSNARNTFAEAFLMTKGLPELKGLASLAVVQENQATAPGANYGGLGDMFQRNAAAPAPVTNEEPLVRHDWNKEFAKK